MSSFYWYDLETFGINPKFDRIAQFAGIRTDLELNPIAPPDMFYCQTSLDTIVDPESCLITGITPQECDENGILEKDFAQKINEIFCLPQTCVVGYNSMRFDDEFIRYTNYRNLIDPYYREWANGNKRWDIIDVVRACYALRPEGIQWPMHEEGKPSFKLTDLTDSNNLTHTSAHDALSDVEATISVAKLIKNTQPKLFDYCLKLRDKSHVKSLLNWSLLKPIVHVSSKIPAERGCLAIMLPLAAHPSNSNGVICYDLAFDPQDLFDLDVDEIQDRLYTPQTDLPEGIERVPLKTIHINKSPIVCPLNVLKDVDLDRIKLDYEKNKQHLEKFKNSASLVAKVQNVFNQAFDDEHEDVDTQLYSGFFSPQDKANFLSILKNSKDSFCDKYYEFKDPRAQELVWRFKARNFHEQLSINESSKWKSEIKYRFDLRFGEELSLWFEKLNHLKQATSQKTQIEILNSIETYTKNKLLRLS